MNLYYLRRVLTTSVGNDEVILKVNSMNVTQTKYKFVGMKNLLKIVLC